MTKRGSRQANTNTRRSVLRKGDPLAGFPDDFFLIMEKMARGETIPSIRLPDPGLAHHTRQRLNLLRRTLEAMDEAERPLGLKNVRNLRSYILRLEQWPDEHHQIGYWVTFVGIPQYLPEGEMSTIQPHDDHVDTARAAAIGYLPKEVSEGDSAENMIAKYYGIKTNEEKKKAMSELPDLGVVPPVSSDVGDEAPITPCPPCDPGPYGVCLKCGRPNGK